MVQIRVNSPEVHEQVSRNGCGKESREYYQRGEIVGGHGGYVAIVMALSSSEREKYGTHPVETGEYEFHECEGGGYCGANITTVPGFPSFSIFPYKLRHKSN